MLYRKELQNLKKYLPNTKARDIAMEYGIKEYSRLCFNENALGSSPLAVEAITNGLYKLNNYPEANDATLIKDIAAKLSLNPSQIIVANGGEEVIKILASAVVGEGDEIIVNSPTFYAYETSANIMGGKALSSPLDDNYNINCDEMMSFVNRKTKMVCLCNPNNPVGNIIPFEIIERFARELPEEILLFVDEAYYEFAIRNPEYRSATELLSVRKNVAVLRTFSKAAGLAGLRVGYLISNPELISELSKLKFIFNVNYLAQLAASAALKDEDFINKTVDTAYASLAMMMKFFDERGLSYVKPSTNFIWVDTGKPASEVIDAMMKKGYLLMGGQRWGYENHIRISSANLQLTERFLKDLSEVL